MDAVQKAKSGHPGAPMGLADIMQMLWRRYLKHNPSDSNWVDRDRFVLSNGHGSMLLYSALHLSGYPLSMDDLKDFRQLHSKTAGHPEFSECPGVETTTGPLGQGFATAVGMALAEKKLAAEFNLPENPIVDHRTWVMVGDGCLMEGISHEAASLAGTLQLGKLICLYDDNGISIDGDVTGWYSEDVPVRFESYGWRVLRDVDGHNPQAIQHALSQATLASDRPTLVCFKTTIGFGSPNKAGTAAVHGAALGDDEIELTRDQLGWSMPPFEISDDIYAAWNGAARGQQAQQKWQERFAAYAEAEPAKAAELVRRLQKTLPEQWDAPLLTLAQAEQDQPTDLETRKASQRCIGAVAEGVPELFGGSADLTGSNNTRWSEADDSQHMSYGVREFAMTAITNGIQLHGGYKPFSGTFLIFMDYARNAVRLAALMRIPNIFVYTHDSVAVGEDGPTHQPVEQLASLRATPNLSTWRPCDTVESAYAWRAAVASEKNPTALVFTRQKTEAQKRSATVMANIQRGGYVLVETAETPEAIIIATGSEVALAVQAAADLASAGVHVRVVSMPCVEQYLQQDGEYQESVLPSAVRARVAVEAAHSASWYRFVGLDGAIVGIDCYGLSGPGDQVLEALGVTVAAVTAAVRRVLS
tara:strand:+ start:8671 stop:10602 length:1932 start_codon:yes stop_codon:yes gene_type:complete